MYWAAKLKRVIFGKIDPKLPKVFAGNDAKDKIKKTLSANPAIQGDEAIIDSLINNGELVFFCKGDHIIKEGELDNDVYFLLSGEVDIVLKRQLGSKREAPNQVGEMAAIDLGKKRSADVYAATDEVAALKVPGTFFNDLWSRHSHFQSLLQVEMSSRHRERISANKIAKQHNSVTWFAISVAVGVISGLTAWLFITPNEWTVAASMSFSAGIALILFIFTLLYNPVFFWRRCCGLVLLAMIGTFALDQFILIEANQGFGNLQINIKSKNEIKGFGATILQSITYICALVICAGMDYLNRNN